MQFAYLGEHRQCFKEDKIYDVPDSETCQEEK